MSEIIHVVVASEGEYSRREEWICGVYGDLAQAKRLVEEHTAKAAAVRVVARAWWDKRHREIPRTFSMSEAQCEREAAWERDNPDPGEPEADRFWIVSAPIGEWGHYADTTEGQAE